KHGAAILRRATLTLIHRISRPKNSTETHSGSKRKSKALVKHNALKRLESLINDNATGVLVP
ncbi:hypothetical protein Bpfe_028670, partial [Biomphalaria pfeifferi]